MLDKLCQSPYHSKLNYLSFLYRLSNKKLNVFSISHLIFCTMCTLCFLYCYLLPTSTVNCAC
ncbi:hypothetical protein EJB10_02645 [Wolbachia endosymbiont of Brugia malayi]|nr:hypothetical protein EJB10_02645 [Wolbachia endosymbiont of Brugia malayi]